jgi:hypothetical protein
MPSKKQRRRQQKLHRHEYEEVYVDAEGNELPPEEAEQLVATTRAPKPKTSRQQPAQRGARTIEPPSWRRTARRGLIFFPLMLVTVMLLGRELTLATQIVQTIVLMTFFLPFSYLMDTMVWRSYQRRLARTGEKK